MSHTSSMSLREWGILLKAERAARETKQGSDKNLFGGKFRTDAGIAALLQDRATKAYSEPVGDSPDALSPEDTIRLLKLLLIGGEQ